MTAERYVETLLQEERQVLSGQWGTIGPYMMRAGAELAALTGAAHGLLCHSGDAAYEAALRTFCKGPGAVVLLPAVCTPADALVPAALGFEVVFFRDRTEEGLKQALAKISPAVCVCDAETFADRNVPKELCRKAGVPLILCGGRKVRYESPLTAFADVAVYDLGEGSEVDAMGGGLLATDSAELYATAYAVHNCGRPFGADCTLTFDDFVGGDLRVAEWNAAAALTVLSTGAFSKPEPYAGTDMSAQPLFQGKARVL